jgi:hypothetical protein
MKSQRLAVQFTSLLGLIIGLSGEGLRGQTITSPRAPGGSFDWQARFSSAGSADIAEGTRPLGEMRHTHVAFEGSTTLALGRDSAAIVGLGWRRFDFSGSVADVPDSLSSLALKLGYSRTFSPQWSLRAEIDPGIYSDFEDVGSDDLSSPFGLRVLYAAKRELQWAFAVFVDPRSSVPVIGGIGARWQFAPQWTLLAFLPEPRVEFAASERLRFYAGASLRGGTFQVAEDFGRRRGRPLLDEQKIDFREISLGAGARWELSRTLFAGVGLGWMLDRRFEYEDRDLLFNGDGAPMFSVHLSGSF